MRLKQDNTKNVNRTILRMWKNKDNVLRKASHRSRSKQGIVHNGIKFLQ